MLHVVIKPTVKIKHGNLKSSTNYRESMISSNFYEMLGYCILPYIKDVHINHRQFGYKSDSYTIGTSQCTTQGNCYGKYEVWQHCLMSIHASMLPRFK